MKKVCKIIHRLEESTSHNRSSIEISQRGEKVFYEKKENHALIQMLAFVWVISPLLLIYFKTERFSSFGILMMIACSILSLLAYLCGPFQTNNSLEIDRGKGEIVIHRKGLLGKSLLKDKIIKTQKSNKVVKDKILFSNSDEIRITLQYIDTEIPLLDLPDDSHFDAIYLSLRLLMKGE